MNIVEFRAHRRLKRMTPYHDLTVQEVTPPAWIEDAGLKPGEGLIGVYIPYPDEAIDSIVIGTEGLHIERDGGWLFICYREIESVALPEEFKGEGKLNMTYFIVFLSGGRQSQIRIPKHHCKWSDIPGFMRFLLNIKKDVINGKI